VSDSLHFAGLLLLSAGVILAALFSNRLGERLRVPAPALVLVAAAVLVQVVPDLHHPSGRVVEELVTVALVLILFDGGMHIGWGRMRPALAAVAWLGVAGTVVTTAALAVLAHALFGFGWEAALLLGAALAPTDPAVVFSVLGRREITGRSGTLLQGESGANDPVGIAIMVSLLAAGSGGWGAVGNGVWHFVLQMSVGTAVGLAGGWLLVQLMRRVPLPSAALYPVQTVAFALLLYGAAASLEGSGFLAVFIAGVMVGDERAPYKREIENFAGALSGLAEIVAFVVLGLSVDLTEMVRDDRLWVAIALAVLLILVVRPVVVGAVLAPIELSRGERAFVLFSGLKGAVPILLGTYVVLEHADRAGEIYDIVFVVVLISVMVQGGLVPTAARLFGVPMRVVAPEPWSLGMRFRDEPEGLRRYVVAAGSPADGCSLADLDVGESFWVSLVGRGGRLVQVRGDTVLRAGDEVLALAEEGDSPDHLFRPRR
jgi:potassium/hydrogen antiporter